MQNHVSSQADQAPGGLLPLLLPSYSLDRTNRTSGETCPTERPAERSHTHTHAHHYAKTLSPFNQPLLCFIKLKDGKPLRQEAHPCSRLLSTAKCPPSCLGAPPSGTFSSGLCMNASSRGPCRLWEGGQRASTEDPRKLPALLSLLELAAARGRRAAGAARPRRRAWLRRTVPLLLLLFVVVVVVVVVIVFFFAAAASASAACSACLSHFPPRFPPPLIAEDSSEGAGKAKPPPPLVRLWSAFFPLAFPASTV